MNTATNETSLAVLHLQLLADPAAMALEAAGWRRRRNPVPRILHQTWSWGDTRPLPALGSAVVGKSHP